MLLRIQAKDEKIIKKIKNDIENIKSPSRAIESLSLRIILVLT